MYNELTTPVVIVDLDTVERNIAKMADKLKKNGIAHRPHIKTHKSVSLAKLQLAAGASGITVAKLAEAEVFAGAGFDDMLVAYSIVGEDKLARFASLHKLGNLITTVDSLEGAKGLSGVGVKTGKKVRVLIEIDGGLHRGGRQAGEDAVRYALEIKELPGIEIAGIMVYFGQIYQERGMEAMAEFIRKESALVRQVAEDLTAAGIQVQVVSSGSTPSSALCEYMSGVTEVRAGNYIFNDASAVQLGLAREADCALRVVATVISTPLPGRATIDAGSKTLSSDKAQQRDGFGIVVGYPGITIAGLNEEHGYLTFDPAGVSLRVGDRIEIIPNHACVLPNLCDSVDGVRGGVATEKIKIDARGCNF